MRPGRFQLDDKPNVSSGAGAAGLGLAFLAAAALAVLAVRVV